MIDREALRGVKETIVQEAQTDLVGLWAILREVKQVLPSLGAEEAKQATLEIVNEVLTENRLVAGTFADDNDESASFVPWTTPSNEALERMDQEWASLDREPTLGEVAWFVATELLPIRIAKHPMGKDWQPIEG